MLLTNKPHFVNLSVVIVSGIYAQQQGQDAEKQH